MSAFRVVLMVALAAKPDAPKTVSLTPATVVAKPMTMTAPHGTECASCHATSSWSQVRFDHDATGFVLKGQHAQVGCKHCHTADFRQPLPTGCAGCHLDQHGGDLGQRCESCHNERSWESEFSAESHRRTNFPLLGGHAVLPCVECHVEARERRFSRTAVPCANCHQGDVARTVGTAIDHVRLGFGDQCVSCHSGVRFKPARFEGHDVCLVLSGGPHGAVTCEQCHANGVPQAMGFSCMSHSATCTNCHTHQCAGPQGSFETDKLHTQVQGYQCRDAKCSECHQLGTRVR